MIEILGTIGAVLLAACPIPQAYQTIKTQSAKDISWGFLTPWLVGEIFIASYVALGSQDLILLFNYGVNLMCLLPIVYIKAKTEIL